MQRERKPSVLILVSALLLLCALAIKAAGEDAFSIRRIGNINPYGDNQFQIHSSEGGTLTISVHDQICLYRTITMRIEAGDTIVHWDGCGYNQEKLYEKTYTITAELSADSGAHHSISFASPIEYPEQCLQYALPSSDVLFLDNPGEWFLEYRTVKDGTVCIEMSSADTGETNHTWRIQTAGGKIGRKEFPSIAGRTKPEPGDYTVTVYETSRPSQRFAFPLSIRESAPARAEITLTGEIMPDRTMSDTEIWDMMMQPSVVVDIGFFEHQKIFSEPDPDSASLGTLHGQTQGLRVIRIEEEWALIGAWNHEEAAYVEGWVPVSKLKTEYPKQEYGILIDKKTQTLTVYRQGKKIDTLLVSTGRAEKKSLFQETSAGCFLTGYHRVNFSMNGKKYDYVIQYDGGNLLHQTPYDWGKNKKDFTLGRGYLGAKASHACIRIQPEPGEGGLNAYWIFTHIPYHTRVIILDDPDEREDFVNKLRRDDQNSPDLSSLHTAAVPFLQSEETVEITFGGGIIPGGKMNGYDSALSDVKQFFAEDDLSCVSLCDSLQDGVDPVSAAKGGSYAPKGTEEIFRDASIELIRMTDGRAGGDGAEKTQRTLSAAGLNCSILGQDSTFTVSLKGHLFGFAGCSEAEYLKDPAVIDRRIAELKNAGCVKIIFLISWDDGRESGHPVIQEAMAHRSVLAGADLVVGYQQGAVGGIDLFEDVPVVYSTGDLLNGSTQGKTKNRQGMLIRASFGFDEKKDPVTVTVIPILTYGKRQNSGNDLRPTADLSIQETETVIRSIWKYTADRIMDRICFFIPDQS